MSHHSVLPNLPHLVKSPSLLAVKEIDRMNERIKALLDLRKLEHDDNKTHELYKKSREAKVKRTRDLRRNHQMNM